MKSYDRRSEDVLTQGDGAYSIEFDYGSNATSHQVYVAPEDGATGSVAISYRPRGGADFIPLLDSSDTQIAFDLSAPGQPAIFDGDIDAIRFTPSDVTVGYIALASGWV